MLRDHIVKGYTLNKNVVGDINTITSLLVESQCVLREKIDDSSEEIIELAKAVKEITSTLKDIKTLLP